VSPQEASRLVWYFDFVSPYSYLQFEAYPELMQTAELRPVLFAGLLNHWGGKGPAEIPAKRLQAYRYTYRQGGDAVPCRSAPRASFEYDALNTSA